MALLEVKGIEKKFGNTEVLKGIDFDLDKGQVLSIIGSSGSGKTTLLRCLNYLETADKGTVKLEGRVIFEGEAAKAVKQSEIAQNRLNFGMVFQSFNLFPQYTALKNVMLAPNLSFKRTAKERKKKIAAENAGLPFFKKQIVCLKEFRAQKKEWYKNGEEKAKKLLERVGLADKMDYYPCQLSGGQQQRVAIARALAMEPKILCFDEPTSALDPELTGEVLKVIRGLKNADSTMIIVTHEMEFARNVSDKIIFMANGVIEEEGTPEEVFGNPKSEKLRSFLANSRNK